MLNATLSRLNGAAPDKTVHENLASDNTGHIAETLNTALKNKLVHTLTNHGYNSLAALLENMAAVDIAAYKDVSLRDFVTAQLRHMAGNSETAAKAISELEEMLSDTTTVGELLGLDKSLKDHPVLGNDVQRARLSAVLGTSPVVTEDLLERFIQFFIQHSGKIEEFWDELRALPEFLAPGLVEAFQFALQLDKLTQGNVPLMEVIQDIGRQMGIQSTRDLTTLSVGDWEKLIGTLVHGQPIPVPDSVPGATREEQVANYIEQIMGVLKQAFPTAYVAQAIARQPDIDLSLVNAVRANNPRLDLSKPLPGKVNWGTMSAEQQAKARVALETLRKEIAAYPSFDHTAMGIASSFLNSAREAVSQFLNNAPDFDFHKTNIDTYLAEKGAVQSHPAVSQSDLADQLKRTQRVYRVTRDPQAIHTLLGAGLHSAHSIASIPQASFVATFKDTLGGETQAKAVHARASTIHATAAHAYMTIYQNLHDVSPRALGPVQQGTQDALNGTQQSTQTALSPRLNGAQQSSSPSPQPPTTPQQSPYTRTIPDWSVLFGSPMLSDCEDCHSLYSPGAYLVDLLQFLEGSMLPAGTTISGVTPTGNNGAVLTLRDVLFARRPDLQYMKLSCENTDTLIPYIDLVNEILETYIASNAQTTDDPNIDNDLSAPTADELSVNPQHVNLAAYSKLQSAKYPLTLPYNRSVQMARTYLANMGSSYNEVMRTFQVNRTSSTNANPSNVTIACEYLGISPEEYSILVDTTPNPAYYGYPAAASFPPANLSQVETTDVQNPGFIQCTSIHYPDLIELLKTRFLNPQRQLTLQDTSGTPDSADLTRVTITKLDSPTAVKAHRFIRLWKKLGWQIRDLDRVMAALGATDIDSTFLSNLAQVQQLLTTLSIPLTSLLTFWSNIDTYEYETQRDDSLYAALFQNKAVLVDPAFALNAARTDLANPDLISNHAAVILAALNISAADLHTLTTTVVTNNTLNLANLSMLYRYAVLAKALNLSLSDLIALQTLSGGNPFTSNPARPVATIWFITALTQIRQAGFSVAQLTYLYQHIFGQNAGIAPSQDTINLFFQQLSAGLVKAASDPASVTDPTALVKKTLSSTFNLSMDVVEALVGATPILSSLTTPGASLMQDFLAFANPNLAPSPQLYYLLHKVALLINTFGLTAKEITYISAQSSGSDFAGFNFNKLPLASGGPIGQLFTQWQRLSDLVTLRNSLPASTTGLVDIFSAAITGNSTTRVSANTMQQLLAATGWNASEVGLLVQTPPSGSTAGFGLNDTNFRNATWLLTLQACLSLGQRLGVSVAHLFTWATTPSASLQSVAQEIKNAVRAKYNDEQWLAVARPLTDQLRESQKAALIAYILQMPPFAGMTSNDLYENFLIDVDMNASTMTSRVVQATLSVQLLVERALMGLDSLTAGAVIDPIRWDWMKQYRTWEANRKIFLYPENYLDPALRDDKSPFFQDLEARLLQQDITMDSAEDAFLSYLEKLDQVARLEICGMYWEEYSQQPVPNTNTTADMPIFTPDWRSPSTSQWPDFDVLHVFGRTYTMPHIYYYRRFITAPGYANTASANPTAWSSYWTAWEKVDLNIEGDHLIPVVYNRRLYLCWPIFTLQGDPGDQSPGSPSGISQPATRPQIQMAWSEYKQGKWTPRQLSSVSYIPPTTQRTATIARNQYLFKALFNSTGTMDIQVLYTSTASASGAPPTVSATEICRFEFSGTNGVVSIVPAAPGTPALIAPPNSQSNFMGFSVPAANPPARNPLIVLASDPANTTGLTSLLALNQTPGAYTLLYPHQYGQFTLQAPFFYQDSLRTYFVKPDLAANLTSQIANSHSIIPNYNANLALNSSAALTAHLPGEAAIFKPGTIVRASVVTPPAPQTATVEASVVTPPAPQVAQLTSVSAPSPETTASEDGLTRPLADLQGADPAETRIIRPMLSGTGGGGGDGTPILDVSASVPSITLGVPQTLTVYANDDNTGNPVAGTVTVINGVPGGSSTTERHPTNTAFTTTFHRIPPNNFNPSITVTATRYPGTHPVPVPYVTAMRVSVSPSPISLGVPQPVTISATDADTGAAIAGTATITSGTGISTQATNTPFTFTFHRMSSNTLPTISVSAAGYASVSPFTPSFIQAMTPGISPAQIPLGVPTSMTISATDADTGQAVNGTVTITNGALQGGGSTTEIHPTNTAFTTALYLVNGTNMPTAVITASGYAQANLQFSLFNQPTMSFSTSPAQVPLNTLVNITVNVVDSQTQQQVPGTVVITNGTITGGKTTETHPTNTAFSTMLYPVNGTDTPTAAVTASVNAPNGHPYPSGSWMLTIAPPSKGTMMRFFNHQHIYVPSFIQVFNQVGIDGLLSLSTQQLGEKTVGTPLAGSTFSNQYSPVNTVIETYPVEDVEFGFDGNTISYYDGYALYNWELFFHIPLLIATKLSSNQRFEDAQHWFHYIFNPISGSPSYWNVQPFNQITAQTTISQLLYNLDQGNSTLAGQVADWEENPFDPYRVARLRITAFQKYVVMKYLDNLIAWGDQLFSQDTMESINEATQLYVLAYQILGPRPEQVPARGIVADNSYSDLVQSGSPSHPQPDAFSNAMVTLENLFPFSSVSSSGSGNPPQTFYFCVPQNDTLLGYWDTVEDRLFKIRHSLTLAGVAQQLPLFAPPISPALLVQAAAMGVDLSSALSDISPSIPLYRFTYMLQKALELCADLKTLGGALLSALEKKDAEALAVLRASQETGILQAVRQIKVQQITEAQDNVAALQQTLAMTQVRHDFYQNAQFMNDWETIHLALVEAGGILQAAQGILEAFAGVGAAIPNITIGVEGAMGSPVATVTYGGENVSSAGQSAARVLGILAGLSNTFGSMSATMGGYQRRWDEWQRELNALSKELDQINNQIAAAQIRAAIAQIELDNQDKQIANASAIEAFLHSKYTNQELYDWMISQVSSVFFQSYQMAYDLAKRAERAYQFERGLQTSNYIKFGYWDSLRSGLLSGEQLYLDLKRLELAYLDQNAREYEISKQISLAQLNPIALIALKETGTCTVTLPELFFDMDYPGHYMRRIKSVALTIPCVAGPYTSINCTLTLQSSKIRMNSNLAGSQQDPYMEQPAGNDPRFAYNFGATGAIATSSAQNDSGMFEVNFRDERYLPFEGNGVISSWQINLPLDCNAFDFETISDVIIKLNYTARDGGSTLATAARGSRNTALAAAAPVQQRLFSAKHEFFNDWYRFLHPAGAATSQVLPLDLTVERFPFLYRAKKLTIHDLNVYLKLSDGFASNYAGAPGYSGSGQPLPVTLAQVGSTTAFPVKLVLAPVTPPALPLPPNGEALQGQTATVGAGWTLTIQSTDVKNLDSSLQQSVTVNGQTCTYLNADAFEDLWIICQYSVQ